MAIIWMWRGLSPLSYPASPLSCVAAAGAAGAVGDPFADRVPARGQGVGGGARRVLGVVHDVDLLSAELHGDGADALAVVADAGALRVDVRLGGPHGDLRAVPGFAREGDDLDRSVDDFGDLQLEEAADEVGVGAREAHGGPPRADRDVQDEGADAVAVAEPLGRHLLLGAQDRGLLVTLGREGLGTLDTPGGPRPGPGAASPVPPPALPRATMAPVSGIITPM